MQRRPRCARALLAHEPRNLIGPLDGHHRIAFAAHHGHRHADARQLFLDAIGERRAERGDEPQRSGAQVVPRHVHSK